MHDFPLTAAQQREATALYHEMQRMERNIRQVQVDELSDRLRDHDTGGCFAESGWLERTQSAFEREFGTGWLLGAFGVGFLFGMGLGALLVMMGVQ